MMNFWLAQREARSKTALYLSIFFILTLVGAIIAEYAMRTFAPDAYPTPPLPYVALSFLGITFLVAGFNYMNYLQSGGSYVAESVGAQRVDPATRDPKKRQLLNIIQEISVAASLPVPPVYILEANEINAFAAGTNPDNAAVTVTRGCLDLLNRDELQGVLAHEIGHIYNRDMLINMRVSAMIMGFFIISYLGIRLLESSAYGGFRSSEGRNGDDKKGGNPLLIIGLILIVAGSLTWFFGSILQAMVSRQREYLADASSVQYTRNPLPLANALRKIANLDISDMPRSGQAFSHLYFNAHDSLWSRLFATHPPIEDRIAAIEGQNTPPPPPKE